MGASQTLGADFLIGSDSSNYDFDSQWSAKRRGLSPAYRFIHETKTWIAPQQTAEDNLKLEAREGSPEAVVDAAPESQVFFERPRDVEAIGVREDLGVAIRRADREHHGVAGGDRPSANRDVLQGATSRKRDRRIVSQAFLDGLSQEASRSASRPRRTRRGWISSTNPRGS